MHEEGGGGGKRSVLGLGASTLHAHCTDVHTHYTNVLGEGARLTRVQGLIHARRGSVGLADSGP